MITASRAFRRMVSEGARVLVKGQVAFADGTRRDLSGDDIMDKSLCWTSATSAQGSFDIGGAITGSFSVTLNNSDGRFEQCDFTGARVAVSVGIDAGDGIEWLRKGTYWVEQPDSYGETIALSCSDSLCLLDRPYDDVRTVYPATASAIMLDICEICGVPLLWADFANSDTVFERRPEGCTCREVAAYVAQATGNFVRATADDRLLVGWYDTAAFDEEDWLDGQEFDEGSPYQSGSDADGGDFSDYSSGAAADGGSFNNGKIASIFAFSSATVMTDDVAVTGVMVTASDEVDADGTPGREGESFLFGEPGYVLSVEGNPLIAFGGAEEAARRIGERVVGMEFRPFDVSCIGDPTLEPGDPVVITDRNQNSHRSYATCVAYKPGRYAAVRCSAEPPMRNASAASGPVTRAIKDTMRAVASEKTAREVAVQRLNDDLENSPGMYTTSKQEGGATTWYVHDKRELAESRFVWKVNAAGLGISTDGGKSYQFGLDKWGDAILNTVYAIGLDAKYIKTGALTVRNGDKTVFCADVSSGQFWWSAANSSLTPTGFLQVTSGRIGIFDITSDSIRYNRPSLTSSEYGLYIDPNGVSTGNGAQWNAMSLAAFYGGYKANSETGYVSFNTYDRPSGLGGVAIGGRGYVGIFSPKFGAAGRWSPRTVSEYPAVYAGQSGVKAYLNGRISKQGSCGLYLTFQTLSNIAVCDASGKVTGRYASVKVPTGIAGSITFPTYEASSMAFTQGLMTTA